MSDLELKKISNLREFGLVSSLRTLAYVVEQKCPLLEEFDADEDRAEHYLAYADGQPVATCRVLYEADGLAKIGRIVTAQEHRGKGYASSLLKHVIGEIQNKGGIKSIKMSAQLHALTLYGRLGFEPYGETYQEAGLPHQMVSMSLG